MKRPIRLVFAVVPSAAIIILGNGAIAATTGADATLEEVVVTGSRIATPELQTFAPTVIVNSAAIENTGTINISTTLRDLPSVGTSALSTANSNFLTSGAGINTINLRNLGDQRTLVLVNGRRMTPGVAGTSDVDLNTIPTEFIDHVEIVTGGASAIYGSDAVAGVVNIIYKKDLEGLTVMGQAGQSGDRDSGNYTGGLLFGTTVADGRGHLMFNLSHDKDQGLRSAQRKFSATDMTVTGTGLKNPQFSSYIPQGNYFFNSSGGGFGNSPTTPAGAFSFNPDGSLINQNLGPGFNRSSQRSITVPVARTLLASTFTYDITDHHHAYAEVTFADTKSNSRFEPQPLAANSAGGVYGNGTVDANGDTIGMPVTNAYLQTLPALAPIVSEINAWNSTGANCTGSAATNPAFDCIRYITFRRRLTDVADRGNDAVRQTYRLVLGANGDIGLGDWTYDFSYTYGRTTDDQISHGGVNLPNVAQALNSVVDPVSGKIVCADPVAVNQGCIPINIFGINSIKGAGAAYVAADITRNVVLSEEVTSASAQGSLFELPAGKVALVVGAEARKDASSEIQDPLTNLGLNGSNALPNVEGSITVKEVFTELNVPVLKDLPGVKSLDLNGAFRLANYSTTGHVSAWKVGVNWAVLPDLRVRGVYSRAVRAPNVGELYGGVSQNFAGVNDPCDGITPTSNANTTAQIAAACRALPGVAAALAGPNHQFAYTALELQQIFELVGSNPALNPEKSKTITVGFVVTPSFVPNLSMSVDYFDVKVASAVNAIPFDTSIQDCLLTNVPTFCTNVIRNPGSGKITEALQLLLNVGYIRSTGIDTAIRYGFDLGSTPIGGRFDIGVTETHQLKLEQSVPGAPTEVDLGQLKDGPSGGRLGAGFRDRATVTLDYSRAAFEASWKVIYMSAIQDTTAANGILFQQWNNVPAYTYHDVQARYTFPIGDKTKATAYLGANNVFNKKPPFLPGNYASDITGTNTAADTYDVIGVFLYAGFRVKF